MHRGSSSCVEILPVVIRNELSKNTSAETASSHFLRCISQNLRLGGKLCDVIVAAGQADAGEVITVSGMPNQDKRYMGKLSLEKPMPTR